MGKIVKTSIVIYDNFKNVLIVQKGKDKSNSQRLWSLVGRELKGKETEEKCISKAVDNDLSCVIFNLNSFKEYAINEENEENLLAFTGIIREKTCLHKSINEAIWISERDIDSYEFSLIDKLILLDFFKSN